MSSSVEAVHRKEQRTKLEFKNKDVYGRNVKVICNCGLETGWHTEEWKARQALVDLHADSLGR